MAIPESIKKYKPKQFGAVEIRAFGEYYYVYQISSRWSDEKNRYQKITGKSIGKITEQEGFIPNANGMRILQSMRIASYTTPVVRRYGVYEMLKQLSPHIESDLVKYFPEIYQKIIIFALLRVSDRVSSVRTMNLAFRDSCLNEQGKKYFISEERPTDFVMNLGACKDEINDFLHSQRTNQKEFIILNSQDTVKSETFFVTRQMSEDFTRGCAFLDHISLLYYYGLVDAMKRTKLNDQYRPEEILQRTRDIYQVDVGDDGGCKISVIHQETKDILNILGIKLDKPESEDEEGK